MKTGKSDENIEIKLQLKSQHVKDLELVKRHLNENSSSLALRMALRNMANHIRREFGDLVTEEAPNA